MSFVNPGRRSSYWKSISAGRDCSWTRQRTPWRRLRTKPRRRSRQNEPERQATVRSKRTRSWIRQNSAFSHRLNSGESGYGKPLALLAEDLFLRLGNAFRGPPFLLVSDQPGQRFG